jgi:GxxExxY protein
MNRIERQRIVSIVAEAAMEVVKDMGQHLPLALYKECFLHELKLRTINYREDVVIPLTYKGFKPETLIKSEVLVENEMPLELVCDQTPHTGTMSTILRLWNKELGLIINFGAQYPDNLITKVVQKI